ncbi:MAG: lysophospholipase [Alphaproteobacteria bacterium]
MGRRSGTGPTAVVAASLALAACAGSYQPMGPAVTAPAVTHDAVIAADGYRLPLRTWSPDDTPDAVILAVHGFGDYSNAFADAGAFWADRGIVTYAYDQRGFGATDRPGIWPGTDTLVSDLRATVWLLRDRHPDTPLYLLGHSMGAAVAMATLADGEPAVDGMILVAAAVWARDTMPFYQRWALWVGANTVPWMAVSGQGLDIQPSDNIEMLMAFSRDPLVLKEFRLDLVEGLVDLMGEGFEAGPRLAVPGLFLYGDNEDVLPAQPIEAMLRRLPPGRHVVAFYPDGYHMLLRDLNGAIVQHDIAAWIADSAQPLPSGADARAAAALATLAQEPSG